MDSSSGAADLTRATARPISSRTSSRSRAGNSSSLRHAPSFKSQKEGRGLGGWMSRWQSSRRLLPWAALILVCSFIGYISWSEGELQGLAGYQNYTSERVLNEIANKQLRLESWLPEWIGSDRLEQANGDGDPWVVASQEDMGEENPSRPRNMDEHVAERGSRINSSDRAFGRVVGPFDDLERRVLGAGGDNLACSSQGRFPGFVRRKSFVVVFHELSMTGAPLAMLELAGKLVSCGGTVSAVLLSKRGGLYKELVQRGVMIIRDKYASSWKAAARADLVVAGSAACNAWIGTMLD